MADEKVVVDGSHDIWAIGVMCALQSACRRLSLLSFYMAAMPC